MRRAVTELVDRLFSFMVSLMLYNNIIIYLGTQGYIIGIFQQIKGNLEPVFTKSLEAYTSNN